MERIKSISEAFSMQPITIEVLSENQLSIPDSSQDIKIIQSESIVLDSGEIIEVYSCYNFEGEKKCQYLKKSVNVHYF